MRSNRGWTRLPTPIISSFTCVIAILSKELGEDYEWKREAMSTWGV